MPIRIGTAGWTVPKAVAHAFPGEGGHLARYAGRLDAVEINSSFYRPHRPATYARWAECVPKDFRFAVKVPRLVTHELRNALHDARTVDGTVVIHIETDRYESVPGYETWWDVPIAEVSGVPEVNAAHREYVERKRDQRRPL